MIAAPSHREPGDAPGSPNTPDAPALRGGCRRLRDLRIRVAELILASAMAPVLGASSLRTMAPESRRVHLSAAAFALEQAAAHAAARAPGPVEAVIASAYVSAFLRDRAEVERLHPRRWAAAMVTVEGTIAKLAPVSRMNAKALHSRVRRLGGVIREDGEGPPALPAPAPKVERADVAPPPAAVPHENSRAVPTPEEMVAILCRAAKVPVDVAYSSYKGCGEPDIRAAIYVCMRAWVVGDAPTPYPRIARAMRKSNHSTVIHAISRVQERPDAFRDLLDACHAAVIADGRGYFELSHTMCQ